MFKNLNVALLIHLALITWISLYSISVIRLKSQLNDVLHCEEISAKTFCKTKYVFDERPNIAESDVVLETVNVEEIPLRQESRTHAIQPEALKPDKVKEESFQQQARTPFIEPDAIRVLPNNDNNTSLPNSNEVVNNSSKTPLDTKKAVPLTDHHERLRNQEVMSINIFTWTALLAVSNLTMVAYQVYEYYYCSENIVKPLTFDATEEINALKLHNQALQIELHKATSNNVILSENLQLITNQNRVLLQKIRKYKKNSKASSIHQNENIKRTLFYLEQVYAMLNAQFNQNALRSSPKILRSKGSLRTIVQMARRIQSVRSAIILKRICAELLAPIRTRYNNVYTKNALLRDQIQAKARRKSTTALVAPNASKSKNILKNRATTMNVRNAKSTMVLGINENDKKTETNRRIQNVRTEG